MAVPDTLLVNNSDGSFPNVARLGGQLGPEAARQLTRACAQLRAAGAPASAGRLAGIDEQFDRVDYRVLEKLADPALAEDELAAARQHAVRLAHTSRNISALLPLVFTWIALGIAGWGYKDYLQTHPSQYTKPFLLLWEQGFGGGFLSFTAVATVDFALLIGVLALTVWVHRAEGSESRTRDSTLDTLYAALDMLEAAAEQNVVRAPTSAPEWAEAAQRIIGGAMEETRLLARTGQEAIEQASARLAGIQDQGRDFIGLYSAEIRETLRAVREDNEQFINRTAIEARETLQRLVEQQMDPLLRQLGSMLNEFSRHQETYRNATVDLASSAAGVREAARELIDSAQSYNNAADSMSKNIAAIESAQRDFTARVTSSADSMTTAATAMSEFHGALREMRDGVGQMAANITTASTTLEAVQRKLADTSTALSDSTSALNRATRDLRSAARGGTAGTPRRRFWPFQRR